MQVSDLFIREMPSDCLPRERLLAIGEKALSNQELLAILLQLAQRSRRDDCCRNAVKTV